MFRYDLAAAKAAEDAQKQREAKDKAAGADEKKPADDKQDDEKAERKKPAYEPAATEIVVEAPRTKPSGTIALRGARIITMRPSETPRSGGADSAAPTGIGVIERGDIVITNNRIVEVGPSGQVRIPAGAKTIDVAGKTIMPGLVDIHAHIWPAWNIHKTQVWEYLANLAFGVTTTRDPQTSTTDILAYRDLVETGQMIGPRVFGTGPGVFSQDNVQSLDEARDVLTRYSQYWDTHTIKQYMAGNRQQRQWIVMAAKEQKLMPTLEGGLDLKLNLTQILDGYPGLEHTLPVMPLYKDVVQLVAQSGIVYTPTLLVQYGGPWAENYFYESTDVHGDPEDAAFHAAQGSRRHGAAAAVVPRAGVLVPARREGPRGHRGGGRTDRPRRSRPASGDPGSLGAVGDCLGRHAHVRGPEGRNDLRRRRHRNGPRSRVAGEGQARRSAGARQESARQHPQHDVDPLRDEERRAVRGRHARSGLAATEEAAAPVLVGSGAHAAQDRADEAEHYHAEREW